MQTLLLETKININPNSKPEISGWSFKKNKLVQKFKSSLQILNWFQKLQKKKLNCSAH